MAILVAYDGSEPARTAVERAVASHPDEELILLRVVELAEGYTGAGINLLQEAFDREDDVADAVRADVTGLLGDADVDFRTETAAGDPANEVVEFAAEHDVDHIYVGSHGREGVSRVLLGSVAERIARRAPVSVTIVR